MQTQDVTILETISIRLPHYEDLKFFKCIELEWDQFTDYTIHIKPQTVKVNENQLTNLLSIIDLEHNQLVNVSVVDGVLTIAEED